MDRVKEIITKTAPREISGSRAANRFDYQKNWAICLLLELYEDQSDFLLLLDYHDDIAVLDSEENPKLCRFYQVKTKDPGTWTLAQLLTRKKPHNSILGKLFLHTLTFGDVVEKLIIVSNARLEGNLESGEKTSNFSDFPFSALNTKSYQELCNSLKDELDLPEIPLIKEMLCYLHSDLGTHAHPEQVQGKLVDFFDRLNPEGKHNIKAIYRALSDEFSRKTTYEFIQLDWARLKKAKGFGRKDAERLVHTVLSTDREQVYGIIIAQMQAEGASFMLVRNMSTRAKALDLELIYQQNSSLLRAEAFISKDFISDRTGEVADQTLIGYLQRRHSDLCIAHPELADLAQEDLYLLIARNFYA